MAKKFMSIILIISFVVFLGGFKIDSTLVPGTITGAKIFTKEYKGAKPGVSGYNKTYYNSYVVIDDGVHKRITIPNREIAKNRWDYFGEEVVVKKTTVSFFNKVLDTEYSYKDITKK